MSISGTPTFESNSDFICSNPLPIMGTASFTGSVPSYTAPDNTNLNFLMAVPSGGATDGQVICRIASSGTIPTWEVFYQAGGGGDISMRGLNSLGATVTTLSGSAGPVDGVDLLVIVRFEKAGADLNYLLSVQAVGSGSAVGSSGTASAATFGRITAVTLAPNQGLTDTALGHLWIQQTGVSYIDIQTALVAHLDERAATRMARLCALKSIPFNFVGTASDTAFMGAEVDNTLFGLVLESAEADLGILSELLSDVGLNYRSRVDMQNQVSALDLSYSGFNLSEVPVPVDDDQYTRNDITVSRPRGSSYRLTKTEGRLSVNPPPSGVGIYDDAPSVNVGSDADLPDQAGWRLLLGTVDEARFPRISVNLAHSTFTSNPTLRNQVLAVRPGDRITISNPPDWLPPETISQIVIGFSETIDNFEHRITFNCVPESPYRVGVLDSTTQGRLDTGGSFLTDGASSSDTSFRVSTSVGPVWTTTDVPFDVMVAGERITVTAVSGATSPQTFTGTRSVNGIVKALPQNEDVRLFQPMILAL
jgi:hypothetical protein